MSGARPSRDAFCVSTASASIREYRSNPTAAMCPDCSAPSMLPAPRISRSRQCDLEPGAELRGVEDRLEPLARLVGEPLAAPVEQVRVRAPRRAADPPAQLVELRQPERVGAVDDDRVHVRDVEARLDDRRADEDVGGAVGELEHHLLELALGHLAVRRRRRGPRAACRRSCSACASMVWTRLCT